MSIHVTQYISRPMESALLSWRSISSPRNAFSKKPLVLWAFAALILFTWGMLIRTFNAPAGIEDYFFLREFGLRVNAIGFLLCCAMIFDGPGVLRLTKRAVVVATLAGVALNIYDFMFPGTFSTIPGRAAGLYVQPNTSGIALVFGCVIGLSAIRRRWWQEAFVVVSFIGVLVTFSRESMLAFGCVVLGGSLGGRLSLRRLAVAGGVGLALFVAFNMGNNLLGEKIASSENWSRLTSLSDSSARDRAHLAKRTWAPSKKRPFSARGSERPASGGTTSRRTITIWTFSRTMESSAFFYYRRCY